MNIISILLLLLKIIVIIISVIFALLIIIICMVLFVPIKYSFEGNKYNDFSFLSEIHWLFKAVYVKFKISSDKQIYFVLKIFGKIFAGEGKKQKTKPSKEKSLTAMESPNTKNKETEKTDEKNELYKTKKSDEQKIAQNKTIDKTEKDKVKNNTDSKEQTKTNNTDSKEQTKINNTDSKEQSKTSNTDSKEQTKTNNTDSKEQSKTSNTDSEEQTKTNNTDSKEQSKTSNTDSKEQTKEPVFKRIKMSEIDEKPPDKNKEDEKEIEELNLKYFKNLNMNEKKQLISIVFKFIKKAFTAVKPNEFYINGTIGSGEPALTGEILGAAAIVKGLTGGDIYLKGNFEAFEITGNILIKGSIRIGKIAFAFLNMIFSKPIRKIIKLWWKGRH